MEKKVKMGIGVAWIIGFTFALTGLLFLVIGGGLFFGASDEEAQMVASVFIPLGVIFLVIGGGAFLVRRNKGRRAEKMVASGRYLWAQILEFRPDHHVNINGRHPYMVVACYTDSHGQRHIFKSESMLKLYPDPGLYGKQIRVYYEDQSFRHYYVDTQDLVTRVIEH